ncbi:MAG TPA: MATE family efflux transporter, partial [Isosphaeraceae bacterium]
MTTAAAPPAPRPLPPVLDRMVRGTSWLVLRTVLQAVFVFWSVPLILHAIGPEANGAYNFAWGFGFLQFLLEFGMGSALQRQLSERWAQGDREGVDRAVACGLVFQGAMALVQAVAFVGIAVYLLPHAGYRGASYRLIVQLLWLQALTAPGTALATVVSGVLQAARRYEVLPRAEVAIVTVRFLVLVAGLRLGVDFFAIVAVQTVLGLGLLLGPALWGVLRDLGYVPRLGRIRPADFAPLFRTSVYVFLIQLSVVLADKADTTVLGFALADPGPATSVYQVVSKPFLQVRQTGWMLSYLVMPAAASLAAARDRAGLDRLAYDGPRLIVGLLLPVALLAGIYAAPFLSLWVGPAYAGEARWLRLFLVANIPLVLTVHVQMGIAAGRIRLIAVSNLIGALVNLPLSYALTLR